LAYPADVVSVLIILEAFESVRRHGGIAHGMLNVLMPQIILNGPGIMPLRREVIAARMPELVRMGYEREPGQLAGSRHGQCQLIEADTVIRHTGMLARSSLPLRQPAPSL
jgi:hypothetical protein